MSIQYKLIISMVGLIIIISVLVSGIFLAKIIKSSHTEAQYNLHSIAAEKSIVVKGIMADIQMMVDSFVANPDIRKFVLQRDNKTEPDTSIEYKRASEFMEAMGSISPMIPALFIANPKTGEYIDKTGYANVANVDLKTRAWWVNSVQIKKSWVNADFEPDVRTGKIYGSIYMPVYKGSELQFIAGADLILDSLKNRILSDDTPESFLTLVFSDDGKVILFSGYSMDETKKMTLSNIDQSTGKGFSDFITKQIKQQGDKQESQFHDVTLKGTRYLAAVIDTSIARPLLEWNIAILMPQSEVDAVMYETVQESIITVSLFTFGSIFILVIFSRTILRPLNMMSGAVQELAKGEGDLTMRLSSSGSDEVSTLAKNMNLFIAKLHTIISEIVASGQQMSEKSKTFSEISIKSKESLAAQQDQVSQIATAVNQLSATAQEVASNAESTAAATAESAEHCEEGKRVVLDNKASIEHLAKGIDATAQAMSELEENTQNINNILISIQGIAEQTNLLALNAAIEAARAGEQGRGFAVVADEVRVLSQRTASSTEEIRAVIETLLGNTTNAVETMHQSKSLTDESVNKANEAAEALQSIALSITKIADMSTHIASASEEQRAVTEEVNRNVQSVSQVSDDMLKVSEEVLELAENLTNIANGLNDQVGLFKL